MTSTIGAADPTRYPTPAVSLARLFYDRVEAMPDAEAFRFRTDEAWESVTWQQTMEAVKTIAAGLLALGIQPEERVAIASATRYKWLLADLAIICAGAATTAVFAMGTDAEFFTCARIVICADAPESRPEPPS